jgi:hypothetical protein
MKYRRAAIFIPPPGGEGQIAQRSREGGKCRHPQWMLRLPPLPSRLRRSSLPARGRDEEGNVLNGNSGLSAAMAIRFEKAFGLRAETLLRMQVAHDLAVAREEEIMVEKVA